MSLEPKSNKVELSSDGVHFKGMTFEYPVRLCKLENFRGYKDVVLELSREGRQYYLLIYDRRKGLVGKSKMTKLNAYHALRGLLSKAGFSDKPLSQKEFADIFKAMAFIYVA